MTSLLLFLFILIGFGTCIDLSHVAVLLSKKMDNFYMEPTLELALNLLKKKELTEAASHYGLDISENAMKAAIKKVVLDYLMEEELIAKPDSSDTMKGQQLLELKRLEFQEQEREKETQLKLKELDIKEKEIAMQLKLRELEACPTAAPTPTVKSTGFDVSKHIRLVPPFQETEVDNYFVHFEKIATSLEWLREVWTFYYRVCWWERLGRFIQLYLWRRVPNMTK